MNNRPKTSYGRQKKNTYENYSDDRDFKFASSDGKNAGGKRQRKASQPRTRGNRVIPGCTLDNEHIPAIKNQKNKDPNGFDSSGNLNRTSKKSRGSRGSNSDQSNPLSQARGMQRGNDNFDPEFSAAFLEEGFRRTTSSGENKRSWIPTRIDDMKNMVKNVVGYIKSPRPEDSKRRSDPTSPSSSTKRRRLHQQDSLQKTTRSSRSSKQVIDLASSDADTDEDNTVKSPNTSLRKKTKEMFRRSPDYSKLSHQQPPQQQEETRRNVRHSATKKKVLQTNVYSTISNIASNIDYAHKNKTVDPSPQKKTPNSSTTHGLHESASSSSEQENSTQQTKEKYRARVQDKNAQRSHKPLIPNFNGLGGGDSNSSDEEPPSLLPQGKARPSKQSTELQKASIAAKTRNNPDLHSMQQTSAKKSIFGNPQTEVIDIDDNKNNCGDTIIFRKGRKKSPPKVSSNSSLPADLKVTKNDTKVSDLLSTFDPAVGRWHQEGGTNSVKESPEKQKRRKEKKYRSDDNDEDGEFWGDSMKKNKRTTLPSNSSSTHSPPMKRAADALAMANEIPKYDLLRRVNSVKEREAKQKRSAFSSVKPITRGEQVMVRGLKLGKGLNLTKVNNKSPSSQRRASTKIKPGAAALQSPHDDYISAASSARRASTGSLSSLRQLKENEDLNWGKVPRTPCGTARWHLDADDHLGNALEHQRKPHTRSQKKEMDPFDNSDDDVEMQQRNLINSSRNRMNRMMNRRGTRSSATKKPLTPECITLSSDSEGETDFRPPPAEYEMLRIGVGKTVYFKGCQLCFESSPSSITLRFYKSRRNTRGSVSTSAIREEISARLTQDTLKMMKFYHHLEELDGDSSFSFVALQILPSDKSNNLGTHSNSYGPHHHERKRHHIILQFRTDEDFIDFLNKAESLAPIIGEPGEIDRNKIDLYAEAMIEHSRKKSMYSQIDSNNSAFIAGRDSESILLVYPFTGDPGQMETAAEGLQEASGAPLTTKDEVVRTSAGDVIVKLQRSSESTSDLKQSDQLDLSKTELKAKARKHYVTIRVKDYERLDPEEWLNDSLVDFWMQWIRRHENMNDSDIHFFTSHFYTTLLNEGEDAVMSWTSKKNINVFQKKFIFIPINKDLHWSLCVIVNPGHIMHAFEDDEEKKSELPLPGLIFLDSLSLHRKPTIRSKLQKWLNAEWTRLHGEPEQPSPFNKKTFRLFSPRVPKQNNTWDCGVFVCRYAYAIYQLRDRSFTYGEVEGNTPFHRLITSGAEFDFNMSDIGRFRQELKKLIEKLSQVYSKWRREDKTNPKNLEVENNDDVEGENRNSVAVSKVELEGTGEKENVAAAHNDQRPSIPSAIASDSKPAAVMPQSKPGNSTCEEIDDSSSEEEIAQEPTQVEYTVSHTEANYDHSGVFDV